MEEENETIQKYKERLARNRYEMRMHFKWKLSDTPQDDWKYAEEVVQREINEGTITA